MYRYNKTAPGLRIRGRLTTALPPQFRKASRHIRSHSTIQLYYYAITGVPVASYPIAATPKVTVTSSVLVIYAKLTVSQKLAILTVSQKLAILTVFVIPAIPTVFCDTRYTLNNHDIRCTHDTYDTFGAYWLWLSAPLSGCIRLTRSDRLAPAADSLAETVIDYLFPVTAFNNPMLNHITTNVNRQNGLIWVCLIRM